MDKAIFSNFLKGLHSKNKNAWNAVLNHFPKAKSASIGSFSIPQMKSLRTVSYDDIMPKYTQEELTKAKNKDISIGVSPDLDKSQSALQVTDSSAVQSVDVQPRGKGTSDVSVTFTNGEHPYLYPKVPEKVVQAFINAPSKGSFVNSILSRYSDYKDPHVQEFIREGN